MSSVLALSATVTTVVNGKERSRKAPERGDAGGQLLCLVVDGHDDLQLGDRIGVGAVGRGEVGWLMASTLFPSDAGCVGATCVPPVNRSRSGGSGGRRARPGPRGRRRVGGDRPSAATATRAATGCRGASRWPPAAVGRGNGGAAGSRTVNVVPLAQRRWTAVTVPRGRPRWPRRWTVRGRHRRGGGTCSDRTGRSARRHGPPRRVPCRGRRRPRRSRRLSRPARPRPAWSSPRGCGSARCRGGCRRPGAGWWRPRSPRSDGAHWNDTGQAGPTAVEVWTASPQRAVRSTGWSSMGRPSSRRASSRRSATRCSILPVSDTDPDHEALQVALLLGGAASEQLRVGADGGDRRA